MADISVGPRDAVVERTGFRLSWGAIFAGFVVATALQMVLSLLGMAIGLVAFDPGQGDSVRALGIGVIAWFVLTAVVSLFIGGLTTGRLAGVLTRGDGRLHGVLMWSLSTLLALYLVSMGAGRLLGGVFDVLSRTAAAAAGGVAGSVGQLGAAAVNQSGGLDFGALQREIETTLQQTGDPALQPDSLRQQAGAVQGQATGGTDNQALAQELTGRIRATAGNVDRQDLTNVIAARTGMSRAEAERVATRVETAAANARGQISSTAQDLQQQAGQTAEQAANAASKAAWAALLALGLSLAAAVFGAGRTAPE
ncbi:MAG TPA: hypothetical protein VGR37_18895 [Longimicrobiaceae bacterium]|nr:hypothetical protein [Longimicrobiaceae bacterium]